MRLAICGAYPGLDPIKMLDYPLVDYISLLRHHLDRKRRTQPQDIPMAQQAAPAPIPRSSGQQVIYREATDDEWY